MDEPITPSDSNKDEKEKKVVKRGPTKVTKYPLPNGKTSFESHIKVLKALNVCSNKGKTFVSYSDIAPIANIHETTVSPILKFYNDIGFTESGEKGKYKPKPEIINFLNELEWNEPGSGKVFGELIINTWFGQSVIQFFKMSEEISKDDLIRSLGKCAQAQADTHNQTALNILIKFLEFGKIIEIIEKSKNYHLLMDRKQLDNLELKPEVLQNQSKTEKPVITDLHKNDEEIIKTVVKKRDDFKEQNQSSNLKPDNQIITSETFTIRLNIQIDENTDVEKIADKILRLKERIK